MLSPVLIPPSPPVPLDPPPTAAEPLGRLRLGGFGAQGLGGRRGAAGSLGGPRAERSRAESALKSQGWSRMDYRDLSGTFRSISLAYWPMIFGDSLNPARSPTASALPPTWQRPPLAVAGLVALGPALLGAATPRHHLRAGAAGGREWTACSCGRR